MPFPTSAQRDAAAQLLAREWDADGSIADREPTAYAEWGFGIADMVCAGAPTEALVEYLAVLEEQLGVRISPLEWRRDLATRLTAAVRAQIR